MIRTEMLLEAAGGRSTISRQAPVPFIAECALLRRKRTAELANRIPSLLRSARFSSMVIPASGGREPPDDATERHAWRTGGSRPPLAGTTCYLAAGEIEPCLEIFALG